MQHSSPNICHPRYFQLAVSGESQVRRAVLTIGAYFTPQMNRMALARFSFLIASNNANSLFSQQLRHNALGRAGAALPFTSHTGGTPWNRKTPGLWIRRMTTSQSTSDRYSGETRSTLRIWQGENGTVDHEARKSAGKDGPGMLDQHRSCSFTFFVVKKHKGLFISSPSAHP